MKKFCKILIATLGVIAICLTSFMSFNRLSNIEVAYADSVEQVSDVPNTWLPLSNVGLTSVSGSRVWYDGVSGIYYSYGTNQYVFNPDTYVWTPMSWNGSSPVWYPSNGSYVWSDGYNIYSSEGINSEGYQFVLDRSTLTWNIKTWYGITALDGYKIWSDGSNIYYSSGSDQYVLDRQTSTWYIKTWNGLTSFSGSNVWVDDGGTVFYSSGSNQYVLDRQTSTWYIKRR